MIKYISTICLLGSFGLITAEEVMRDGMTQEQLALLYRQATQQDPMRKQTPTKGPDPSVVNRPKDLVSESDTICFNGNVALVPKRAVLMIPKNLVDRLKYQPGAKLMSWGDFYAINRGWITTVEVSRLQAEGNSPLAEEIQKQLLKTGNLVIATYQTGPISVLPAKAPVATVPKTPKS